MLVKIPHFASQLKCLSPAISGAGITIMQDHYLRGIVSTGKYPMGGFDDFRCKQKQGREQ